MGLLIAAVLFGLGFTLLAIQNTLSVPLYAGGYVFYVPVFLIVLGTLLIGLFIAWLLSAIGWISNSITLRRKDSAIRETHNTIDHLQARVKDLEAENSRLKGEKHVIEEHIDEKKPGFFDKFRPHPAAS